ncbi:MAG: CaiB/BaiF CoA-transferase family protein [Myxococcales bacterium]|nr:CaiB/BaiF CoA-transferase family protein [Myxococcales bacterium]
MTNPKPLAGMRVLDLSRVLAGPYVGRMLADLGSEVVKVEPPDGDLTRQWGRSVAGLSGYYTQQNAGKHGLCVDLQADGGPELIRELAAVTDILVENFRPGVMQRFGLDYQQLQELNPRLVMLSISGFGQTGPHATRPAYASVVHAESGVLHRQAVGEDREPRDLWLSAADMNAGLHGLVGLLAAVVMRQQTGRGQHVDISMLDAMLATDDYINLATDRVRMPHGTPNGVWQIRGGGAVVIAGDFRWVWRRLQATHGLADPTPPGAELATKIECRQRAVRDYLMSLPDQNAVHRALDEAGLPWGDVLTSAQALASPGAVHRGVVAQVDDRAGGKRSVVQSPYRFSHADSGVEPSGAPRRGEHNADVLTRWLGKDAGELEALRERGVLLAE